MATTRHRADLDDNLFEHEDAVEKQHRRAEIVETARQRAVLYDEQEAILRRRARETAIKTNERAILAEYAAAGVEPREGILVSLPMLRKLGWRIVDIDGVKSLMAPPTQPPAERKDYR